LTTISAPYYSREEAPFQWALADAFTICDGYHCSIATGTDPNRIISGSGSNFNPELRAAGINSTDADAEFWNLRCWITGALPTPGYTYRSNPFKWARIPTCSSRLGSAGGSTRIRTTTGRAPCTAASPSRASGPRSPILDLPERHVALVARISRERRAPRHAAAGQLGACRLKSSRSIPVDRVAQSKQRPLTVDHDQP